MNISPSLSTLVLLASSSMSYIVHEHGLNIVADATLGAFVCNPCNCLILHRCCCLI